MTNDERYRAMFISKPFKIPYGNFSLEISVKGREAQHYVKCTYKAVGNAIEAYRAIFHFFNEIVWFYQTKLSDVSGGESQGSHVGLNYSIQDESYFLNFQQKVFDERQHLGLVFYREAQCNESPYYRFFCFYITFLK